MPAEVSAEVDAMGRTRERAPREAESSRGVERRETGCEREPRERPLKLGKELVHLRRHEIRHDQAREKA